MTLSGARWPASPALRSLAGGSLGLLTGKVLQMGAGFFFWVVAARVATVTDLGIAAATISAVMLCTQLGQLGTGSAAIVEIGRDGDPAPVLDTAFTLLAVTSVLVGSGYLVIAAVSTGEAVTPVLVAAFLAATLFGTALICLDQVGVAFGRGGSAPSRYGAGGLAAFVAIAGVWWLRDAASVVTIVVCWSLGGAIAVLVGVGQLRRIAAYRYRPSMHLGRGRRVLGIGLPNQLLTMTERAPALLVPVLVAHTVSPEATAYWYPAWMMAWIVYTAPVQVGLVQFAAGVRHPDRLAHLTRVAVGWSLALGGAMAVGLLVLSDPLLRLMGPAYADTSVTSLRLLTIGFVPYAVLQAYNAVCRAREMFAEGIGVGVVLGVLLCTATVAVADRGATAMALAWIASLAVGASWAIFRLARVLPGGAIDG
ncbi:O-antigen/teichoic acid export membrane protein [Kribbella orskensis]|uniref:O-antigen/teichoic acid export membrane protein n=1 Tax=Kribbella orskensis TaxID=2512216 RepID=A0ABY2BFJ6_9ACTN|nr:MULTISPECIES: MATE family efflux transporter [Kribbella]TCN37646.1 O-antigen/teichoic acid export membrane protein [Kribbella sp. VKM Ac-2500]TCO18852.1 O-antigen/teichoic acid export membrane protein [Kribbella orskensis]